MVALACPSAATFTGVRQSAESDFSPANHTVLSYKEALKMTIPFAALFILTIVGNILVAITMRHQPKSYWRIHIGVVIFMLLALLVEVSR